MAIAICLLLAVESSKYNNTVLPKVFKSHA